MFTTLPLRLTAADCAAIRLAPCSDGVKVVRAPLRDAAGRADSDDDDDDEGTDARAGRSESSDLGTLRVGDVIVRVGGRALTFEAASHLLHRYGTVVAESCCCCHGPVIVALWLIVAAAPRSWTSV
jgi:hypothetical protein